VPGKNIKMFAGKPLFFWIINTLKKVNYINEIIIDTDCEKIAEMVTNYFKVIISIRPEHLRGDFVSVNKIIEHTIKKYPNKYYIQTHVTNPLLEAQTLNEAIEFYLKNKNKYDSVFSVTGYQSRFYFKNGEPVNHNPAELIRTQDLVPLFEENSSFYIFSKESFLKTNSRIGEKPFMFELIKTEAIDIDDLYDFKIAESIKKSVKKHEK
jgi:N-acylneuraminate cytidylyltransferase